MTQGSAKPEYTTAEYTYDETYGDKAGTTITGDVVKANKTTVYVKWHISGRVEPVSRAKPDGVTFR